MNQPPSPNFGERRGGQQPSLVVLHYTAMASFAEARTRLCNSQHEVSAHWLIAPTGVTEALVPESARAWHAGVGEWAGGDDVNSRSIGIELANTGHQPFPEPQMSALEHLLAGIFVRWSLAPKNVIAHSDMAPERKRDPGPRFDWRRLALQKLSVWPQAAVEENTDDFFPALRRFGYPDRTEADLLSAFRLRFRPWANGPVSRTDAGIAVDLARHFPP